MLGCSPQAFTFSFRSRSSCTEPPMSVLRTTSQPNSSTNPRFSRNLESRLSLFFSLRGVTKLRLVSSSSNAASSGFQCSSYTLSHFHWLTAI